MTKMAEKEKNRGLETKRKNLCQYYDTECVVLKGAEKENKKDKRLDARTLWC